MKIYKSRFVQVLLAVLYALTWLGLLFEHNILSPWLLIVVLLLFCALFANAWYVLLSTMIMVVTVVPIWWFTVAPHQAGYSDILGWYPLIIFDFVVVVLLPQMIVVWGRNAVLRKFAN